MPPVVEAHGRVKVASPPGAVPHAALTAYGIVGFAVAARWIRRRLLV